MTKRKIFIELIETLCKVFMVIIIFKSMSNEDMIHVVFYGIFLILFDSNCKYSRLREEIEELSDKNNKLGSDK